MELAKVTSKGQITIPIEIRKKLGIKNGDKILFVEESGRVASVKLITDRETRRSKGFAFVEMPNDGEAKEAIKQLNGAEYVNRTMVVKEALPKA